MKAKIKFIFFGSIATFFVLAVFQKDGMTLNAEALPAVEEKSNKPQYLAFQIFTLAFDPETMRKYFPPTKDIEDNVKDIIRGSRKRLS